VGILKKLGFGLMRLPRKDNEFDYEKVCGLVDKFIDNGFTYFDTAYVYDGSEDIFRRTIAERYPRNAYQLADKLPCWHIKTKADVPVIFNTSLKRCNLDYFDYYLLHNVNEHSVSVYTDKELGVLEYFLEQKRQGRIRHLGFSTHAHMKTLRDFLDFAGDHMEFCQIQFNYLDTSLQGAYEKYKLLRDKGIPVFVMEPLRGGKLARLEGEAAEWVKTNSSDRDAVSLAFRWLMSYEGLGVILSGMSTEEQLLSNIKIFSEEKPTTEEENELLYRIAEGMKSSVPCTSCGYCTEGCPMELDIPLFMKIYNELRVVKNVQSAIPIELSQEDKKPSACIGCGKCAVSCPQKIKIPDILAELSGIVAGMPKWADICREREKAAKM
jgi:predicted aldo/keto reductase-like oxidoreductase